MKSATSRLSPKGLSCSSVCLQPLRAETVASSTATIGRLCARTFGYDVFFAGGITLPNRRPTPDRQHGRRRKLVRGLRRRVSGDYCRMQRRSPATTSSKPMSALSAGVTGTSIARELSGNGVSVALRLPTTSQTAGRLRLIGSGREGALGAHHRRPGARRGRRRSPSGPGRPIRHLAHRSCPWRLP